MTGSPLGSWLDPMPTPSSPARLIAIDWGTTNARSYLLAAGPRGPVVLDQRTGEGILSVAADADNRDALFAAILESMVGQWLDAAPQLPMIACGMVGAAQGWRPAPYQSLPTVLASEGGFVTIQTPRGPLPIIAGVKKSRPNADVIRGEETQLAGLASDLAPGRTALVVMPGTHTKWAIVRDGVLLDFDTAMTGELYSLLLDQSMVGRVAVPAPPGRDWRPAFDWGLQLAADQRAIAFTAFVIRSSVLDEQLPADQVADALSGLLIGSEISEQLDRIEPDMQPVLLVGGAGLVERYQHAFAMSGVESTPADPDATIRGLWRCAIGAGLIEEEK